jgi:hypothetical protein
LDKAARYIRKIERWMMLPGRILSGGEGRDLVHPEDRLEQLRLMKLNLSTSEWNLQEKGKELIRFGICLEVKKSRGWRGSLVI